LALQQTVTIPGGIEVTSAYHRITAMNINIENQIADVFVKIYKDKTTRENGGEPITFKRYEAKVDPFNNFLTAVDVSPQEINHVSQAYEYLKTLPDFQGAQDV
jgi:hypothetical protein